MTRRWLLAVALACACDLPEVTAAGAHVEIAADPGLELCGGTLAHMDEVVARLSAEFSRPPPTGRDRLRFYWLARRDFSERSGCPEHVSGCAHGMNAFSKLAPHDHELVHTVADPIGTPPPFFLEGLAVAYEGLASFTLPTAVSEIEGVGVPDGDVMPMQRDVRDLLELYPPEFGDAGGYPIAGAFTAYLIRTHGLDRFLRVYAGLEYRDDSRAIDREFREVFGVSLEQSIVDFDATARDCGHAAFDAKLVECAAPELAWDGPELVHHRTLACEQRDVVGPFGNDTVVVHHTVEVAGAGEYELRVVDDGEFEPSQAERLTGFAVSLQGCGGCGAQALVGEAGAPPVVGWLDAGRYALRLHGPATTWRSVGFRLARVAAAP